MAKIGPFERYAQAYDASLDEHPWAFRTEVEALGRFWPEGCDGREVGVGSGRFAQALRIRVGVEPPAAMRELARKRGIEAVDGTAETVVFVAPEHFLSEHLFRHVAGVRQGQVRHLRRRPGGGLSAAGFRSLTPRRFP